VVGSKLEMNGDVGEDEEVDSLLFEFENLLVENRRLMLPLYSCAAAGTVTVDGCESDAAERIDMVV
jgi:hypothetical protein